MDDSAKMRIAYDGVSLADGSMDVKDLAPALLAFAELIERANELIGNERKIRVSLKADCIKKGSFDVNLDIAYTTLEQVKLLVVAADQTGLSGLMTVLGWGKATQEIISGVFKLIKIVKNRIVTNTKSDTNQVTIYFSDGDKVAVDSQTFKIFLDYKARKNIENIIRPLYQDGINSFELRNTKDISDKTPIEKISKEEAIYFKAPEASILDNTNPKQYMILKIVSLSFNEDNKWRFSDGEKQYWMTIEDEEFNDKVNSRELLFASGDMLNVEYEHRQIVQNNGKIENIYTITKVIDKVDRPEQIKLPIS